MIKKLSIFIFAFVFVTMTFAQQRNTVNVKSKIPDPNFKPTTVINPASNINLIGETFITTGYDYAANNIIPIMVDLADIDGAGGLDPIFTAMKRDVEGGDRLVIFGYKAFDAPIDAFNSFPQTTSNVVGWGNVQTCSAGPLAGNALLMAHNSSATWHSLVDLTNLEIVLPAPTVTFGGNFPSFAYLADGTIWGTTTDAVIYKSTDQGGSFNVFATVGDGDANVNVAAAVDQPSEFPIYKSADDQNLAIVSVFEGAAVAGNPDIVYWYGSGDAGASWNGLIIGVGSGTNPEYGQVANNPNYAPYFENFSQITGVMSDQGVTHVMSNGYGEATDGVDTVNYYPMVYWNSNSAEWNEISIPAVAAADDGNGNTISDHYPGNGIGQAYPSLSVSPDGQVVFAIWAAPEYTGEIGASAYNIYPGDGSANTYDPYYTDLHWTVSTDGGSTWSAVSPLGEASLSETYPTTAKRLEVLENGDVVVHMMFFVDDIPGTSLFAGENSFSPNGSWQYFSTVVANIAAAPAVTNTLNFTADISGILGVGIGGAFDANLDSLQVMGLDWDNLGMNVVGNRTMVNNDPFNPGIYTASLTVTSGSAAPNGVGDSTKWKFKAYPDARFSNTGWESGSDRWHFYVADGSVIDLPTITPRIYPLFDNITSDISMQFTVDMTGAINQYNGLTIPLDQLEFVGIRGGADFLGNWASGGWQVSDTTDGYMKVLSNIGDNLWRVTLTAPAGTPGGLYEFKYAAMYPGADAVNGGSSPLDNEGGFGINHSFQLVDVTPPTRTIWNKWGDFTAEANDVKEITGLVPSVYELGQNYPNPFNPSTTIKFSVPEAGLVTLRVFNMLGEEVAMLLNSEKTAGVYEASFDASRLSSGVYFYTLEAKNFTSTKKMVLLK